MTYVNKYFIIFRKNLTLKEPNIDSPFLILVNIFLVILNLISNSSNRANNH